MADGLYIYESHLGGFYTSEHPLPADWLYCESCGDIDWELGRAASRAEAKRMIKAHDRSYSSTYINEFLDENFPKEGI